MYKIFILLLFTLQSCIAQNNQNGEKHLVDAKEFSEGMKNQQLVDVRTPGEFEQGHIPNAINYDFRNNEFYEQIKNLDKTQPVYVYCQSGGRSADAAKELQKEGFKVFELKGGMINWRSNDLPESMDGKPKSLGMSMNEYDDLLNGDLLILVDFYAEWCAPCKKMEPFLKKISEDMSQNVKIIRIDVEAHKSLANELKISAIPILILYKNKEMIWEQNGFIGENELREKLISFQSK